MPVLAQLVEAAHDLPFAHLEIRGLAWDSRRVQPGDLFFALPGTKVDGHVFLEEAAQRGAVAAVGEKDLRPPLPYLRVPNARLALARAAAAFYDHPTWKLTTIGVTGTNGKTTVVHLLGQLLPQCETLTTVRVEEEGLSCVTTPEAPELQRVAAQAVQAGRRFFAFEASSIGLVQHRVDGVRLRAAVFLGLGRDHLDFHRTLEDYLEAKLRLFELLDLDGWGVVNAEDPWAWLFLRTGEGRRLTFGVEVGDVQARHVRLSSTEAWFKLCTPAGSREVVVPWPGEHNVRNALAAAATAWALGEELDALAQRLSQATLPPGRFQRFWARNGALVVVDYAHNPQALEAMLKTLRPQARRLFVVFGANGEGDPGKRPWMGRVVGQWADWAVVTSDNPKKEDPERIAAAVVEGLEAVGGAYTVELDRARAIGLAMQVAGAGDVVLVAGKGHERCQHLASGPVPYSDLDVLRSSGWLLVSDGWSVTSDA